MGTIPNAPQPAPNPPSANLLEALDFARETAKQEIDSIDRLHKRTLQYIAAILAVFTFGLSILGFLGYQNLQQLAIGVATRTVEQEARSQVAQKLTQEQIAKIVQQQIQDYSQKELQKQIDDEITKGPLHKEILSIAAAQSAQEVAAAVGQRHLTPYQARKLKEAIASHPELKDYPTTSNSNGMSPEPIRYMNEIDEALKNTTLKFVFMNFNMDYENDDGITLYFDPQNEKQADGLIDSFRAIGLTLKKKEGNVRAALPNEKQLPLVLYVGLHELPDGKK
jgi:hypothetical protein